MTVKQLARRETSKERGRHLLATDKIQAGRLIFCERPMVSLQSTGNIHSGVLVCHYCSSFVGTPEHVLKVVSDPSILPEITTTEHLDGEHSLIPCTYQCGTVYCCTECRDDDWSWGGHKELCTGCISNPDHPIIQFKQHAIQNNEIFLLIAKWLARIHNQKVPYNEDESLNTHEFTDFSMTPWWEVTTLPLRNDDETKRSAEIQELDRSCRRLCEESHALLTAAWPEQNNSQWLTPLGIGRLIGSLEQNCMGIRRKHPIRRNIMEDKKLRQNFHREILGCLYRAGMIGEEEHEEDHGSDCDCSDADSTKDVTVQSNTETDKISGEELDYSPDEVASFLADLETPLNIGSDDDWDDIFIPMDGTAHFCFAEKMNHSCEPNVVLLYKSRGWGTNHPLVAYCIALRDIEPGEELTLSYINAKEPYDTRQEALANYGFVCTCPKCLREKGDSVETTPNEEAEVGVIDDLFGSDEDDDSTSAQGEPSMNNSGGITMDSDTKETNQSGDEQLRTAAEQLESVLNKSKEAAIPLTYLASASNCLVQMMSKIQGSTTSSTDDGGTDLALQFLENCRVGIQSRDFSLCRLVGLELEAQLARLLRSKGSFPSEDYRAAYWCACSTAALGFAQEGSFLIAMQYLDKATILGLNRELFPDLFAYIELYASQMAATPCPHAIKGQVYDYTERKLQEKVALEALSQPIRHPLEERLSSLGDTKDILEARSQPLVLRGFAKEWPATKKWCNLQSLSRAHGHRLIPIEVGSMYTGMEERLCSLRSFISHYLAPSASRECWTLTEATDPSMSKRIAYLAQHPLLDQIPALYDDVPVEPMGVTPTTVNAWIGTGGTRTPLHFDSYDNLLVQIVGAKYVRLYDPKHTSSLYVSKDASYGSQGNMSAVQCEMEDMDKHPLIKEIPYTEVLLLPGDCLYIPSRYWHYVRSLSTSISVNYWF